MQDRQRTVVVVATGLGFFVGAVTINRLLGDHGGGWLTPARTISTTAPPGDSTGTIVRDAAVLLVAIIAWSGLALWLYRKPSASSPTRTRHASPPTSPGRDREPAERPDEHGGWNPRGAAILDP
jgi:hypothetical protein